MGIGGTPNGNAALFVGADGLIGIGKTSSGYKLDVAGSVNLDSGNSYFINGANVLSVTALGSGVTSSSLTSVGTISTGVWQGNAIADSYIASATNWNTAYTNRIATFTTTGSSGAATFTGNTLNIPTYTLAGLGGESAISAGTTSQYWRGDKTWQTLNSTAVGLGNVTNAAQLVASTTSTQNGYFGSIYLYDDSTPSHYLEITNSGNLTAPRTLSLNVDDANRSIGLTGNLTVTADATISGTNTGNQTLGTSGNTITLTSGGSVTAPYAITAGTASALAADPTDCTAGSGGFALGINASGTAVCSTNGTGLSLTAGNLSGTIPSGVLGNSTVYIGTTGIALNRASAAQTLTGVNIDGNAATATALQNTRTINSVNFNGTANIVVEPYIEDDESTNANRYLTFTDTSTAGYKRLNEDSSLLYNPSTNILSAGTFSGSGSGLTGLSTSNFTSANISQWTNNSGYVTTSDDTVSGSELNGLFSGTGILRKTGTNTFSTIDNITVDANGEVDIFDDSGATNSLEITKIGLYSNTIALRVYYATALNDSYAGHFTISSGGGSQTGVYSSVNAASGAYAFRGIAYGGEGSNYGIHNTVLSAGNAYGGYFSATTSAPGNNNVYGIDIATVNGDSDSRLYGLHVVQPMFASHNSAIVIGNVSTSPGSWSLYNASPENSYFAGNVGIGTTAPGAYKLNVRGTTCLDLNADGVCTDNTSAISDARLKENVREIENPLDLINQLRGVRFNWNGLNHTGNAKSLGFIAQEVEQVLPELVITDTSGYKNIDYSKIIGVIVEGMKLQQLELADIRMQLNSTGEIETQVLQQLEDYSSQQTAYIESNDTTIEYLLSQTDALTEQMAQLNHVENRILALENSLNASSQKIATLEATLAKLQDTIHVLGEATQSAALATESAGLTATDSAALSEASNSAVLAATSSATLTDLTVTGESAFNNVSVTGQINIDSLGVTSDTNLNNLAVTGNIMAGILSINGFDDEIGTPSASISTIAGPLRLQSDALSELDIMDGRVKIDTRGNVVVKGSITVDKVNVSEESPEDKSIGEGIIPAEQTEIVITTTAVTSNSRIFVTAKSEILMPLSVHNKVDGASFAVRIKEPEDQEIAFDWWVVN